METGSFAREGEATTMTVAPAAGAPTRRWRRLRSMTAWSHACDCDCIRGALNRYRKSARADAASWQGKLIVRGKVNASATAKEFARPGASTLPIRAASLRRHRPIAQA